MYAVPMTQILYGKPARDYFGQVLKERVKKLRQLPSLAIIQIGRKPESNSYIQSKIKFGREIGVFVDHITLDQSVTESEVVEKIKELNEDDKVDGIIVQLPIPANLSKQKIIDTITVEKDVDGLTFANVARRSKSLKEAITPATARGVMELLKFYKIEVKGKKAAVLGRSELAGHPIAEALSSSGAKVTICHSHTYNEEEITKKSDIVVVAIGKPKFVTDKFFTAGKNQTVIDVGINVTSTPDGSPKLLEEVSGKKFVGDVDFEKVSPIVGAVSPVPGGVGQMTVLGLFENLIDCVQKNG